MSYDTHGKGLQLRSLVGTDGNLNLTLALVPNPVPGDDEVVVRIEASPINPSDLGLLIGAADIAAARTGGTAVSPTLTAPIPAAFMKAMAPRLDQSLPVGNEGAGTVVAAGAGAQALLGKTVAVFGGAMYAQYRPSSVPSGGSSGSCSSARGSWCRRCSCRCLGRAQAHKPWARRDCSWSLVCSVLG